MSYEQEQAVMIKRLAKLARTVVRNDIKFDNLKVHCTHYTDDDICMHLHRNDDMCTAISCPLGGLSEKEWKKLE